MNPKYAIILTPISRIDRKRLKIKKSVFNAWIDSPLLYEDPHNWGVTMTDNTSRHYSWAAGHHRNPESDSSESNSGNDASGTLISDTGMALCSVETTRDATGELSAFHRLILSCLAADGGEKRLMPLVIDILRRVEGSDLGTATPHTVRETYLTVHAMIVDELTEQGIVTYCEDNGTVRLT